MHRDGAALLARRLLADADDARPGQAGDREEERSEREERESCHRQDDLQAKPIWSAGGVAGIDPGSSLTLQTVARPLRERHDHHFVRDLALESQHRLVASDHHHGPRLLYPDLHPREHPTDARRSMRAGADSTALTTTRSPARHAVRRFVIRGPAAVARRGRRSSDDTRFTIFDSSGNS